MVIKESQQTAEEAASQEEVPNPFKSIKGPSEIPEKPVYEQTDILNQIEQSLEWDNLQNNETSFYGLQMKSPEKPKEPEEQKSPETPKESIEKYQGHVKRKMLKKGWKSLQIYMLQSQIE